jgi:hypothetical protein
LLLNKDRFKQSENSEQRACSYLLKDKSGRYHLFYPFCEVLSAAVSLVLDESDRDGRSVFNISPTW